MNTIPLPAALARSVDRMATSLMVVIEQRRAFSRTPPGPPPSFDELLDEVRRGPPEFTWPTRRGRVARSLVRFPALGRETYFDLFPARPAPGAPHPDTLVLYHHGLGEIPHDMLPRTLRQSPTLRARCDLVAIKGLHHEHLRAVSDLLACRDHFTRCMVASAALARVIAKDRRAHYRHLVLCGTSMGGLVTLFEACREPRFDLHVPLVAGPDLADVMLRSSFSHLIQGAWLRRARREPWVGQAELAERLRDARGAPIRPLLGRDDALFRYGPQREAYARIPRAEVATCSGGHITAAAGVRTVLRHLLDSIEAVCWSGQGTSRPAAGAPRAAAAPLPSHA